MNIVMLSGGSGKRLWPLSNEVRSKQFLKVLRDEKGEKQSMLQRVFSQLEEEGIANNVVIATSSSQKSSITSQLNEQVSIVVEPERRNTFPAIALASAYMYFEQKHSLDEPVVVIPVDPYVDNSYFKKFNELVDVSRNSDSDIVLMGVKPTYPSEKYGYIIPVTPNANVSIVKEFKEKPNVEKAKEFIQKGGLWNCGVFVFKLGYIMNILKSQIDFSSYQEVLQQYNKLDKTSFDYAVVENAENISVVSYEGEWADLGTWNTLTEVMNVTDVGKVIKSSDTQNTHVINELDIPITVCGINNAVVVASPDGILVSDKDASSYIGPLVNDIDQRPMFEEHKWGAYTVLNMHTNLEGDKSLTKLKTIKAGEELPLRIHKNCSKVWVVLSGNCIANVDETKKNLATGDTIYIPQNAKHSLKAIKETRIIEVRIQSK